MSAETYLLDTSFLIDLSDEIAAKAVGPARHVARRFGENAFVSVVSIAEMLEGAEDKADTVKLLTKYHVQPLGWDVAERCALNQQRAARKGRRMGENDAFQMAQAMVSGHTLVGCDEAFENRPWLKYLDHRKEFAKNE